MRGFIGKILGYFGASHELHIKRNVVTYGICVIIATVLWFLNALNKEYTTEITYPIKYTELPKGKLLVSEPPKEMTLAIKAHGFALLRYSISTSFLPIVLNVSSLLDKKDLLEYTINTSEIKDRISTQLNTDIQLISIKPREASEDIIQDFFCRLWEDRKRLVNDKSFYAYIYSSVRNRSLNYLRDSRSISIEGFEKQSDEDFLREMMEEEVYRELYAAIQKLPERCRQIFLLKLDGEENQKIADKLQISEETVRSQLRRGKELLQNNVISFYVFGVICYWCDL